LPRHPECFELVGRHVEVRDLGQNDIARIVSAAVVILERRTDLLERLARRPPRAGPRRLP